MSRCLKRLLYAGTTLLGLHAAASRADTRVVDLAPPDTRIEFTTYALGFYPLVGRYERFQGTLRVDPVHPEICTVALDIEVASLAMADPDRVRLALGPKLLDQATFPHLLYRGSCAGGRAIGVLTMHGVSRSLQLTASRDGGMVTAQGSLHRDDFGVTGLPGLIGDRIKITFLVHLPDDLATLVHP